MDKFKILIAGQSKDGIRNQQNRLTENPIPGMQIDTQLIGNNHQDPLQNLEDKPDVLILNLDSKGETHLRALASRPLEQRPPTLVINGSHNPAMMRMAMQVGARDYLVEPLAFDEVNAVVQQIYREKIVSRSVDEKSIIAVINAKGGAGATVLACNLAHILASHCHERTALVDLDLQFGSAALNLGIQTSHTVIEVLRAMDELDALALEGYMTKHPSGLHVLAKGEDDIMLPGEVPVPALQRMLQLLKEHYEQVVVDLPRQIDPTTTAVMEKADKIVIVLQQSLSYIRDAKRLLGIMKLDLEIPEERISVVINRYTKHNNLQVEDIQKALGIQAVVLIPSDFERVGAAGNLGVTLYEYARKSDVTKSLMKFAKNIAGIQAQKRGFLQRLFRSSQ